MKKERTVLLIFLALGTVQMAWPIQTGRVELGENGSYDGTVWIARDSSGSIVFLDRVVASSVTLQQLVAGGNDHGALSGLAADDHAQYHTALRHLLSHTAAFNDDLLIPTDVGNNVTLGGHVTDGNVHAQRASSETISGAWRFTGTPVFASRLRMEIVPPDTQAEIEFGPDFNSPRFRYLGNVDAFEFTRPIWATSGSLANLETTKIWVLDSLDGRDALGQPSAALIGFASVNGIDAANLLDRGVNEDVTGQWDFLDSVRVYGDLEVEDVAASGVLTAHGILLTTGSETAETSGLFSHLESSSDTLKVVLDRNNNTAGYKKLQIFAGDHAAHPAWELSNQGDSTLLSAYTNSGGTRLQIGGDGNSCFVRRSLSGARYYLYDNGNIVNILPSADGSDKYQVLDSGLSELFSVDSDGNLAMAANAAVTVPDGTNGPFVESWHAPALLNATLTANEDLTTGGVWTTAASDTLYFDWPVPTDLMGADVVVDRCTVYYDRADGQDYIDRIRLIAFERQAGDSVAIDHTTDINSGSSHQWIDSDYAMVDDRSYLLAVDVVHNDDGASIRSFQVEYHLE